MQSLTDESGGEACMSVRRAHFFAVQQPPRNLRGLGGKDAQTLAEHIAAE